MVGTVSRIKLLQAITYFVSHTTHCGKAKLYWLLYLLDFKVYAAIAKPVTGLDYYASIDGPVPLALDRERDSPGYDFVEQFHIENLVLEHGRTLLTLRARGPFEPGVFSEFELSTMNYVATMHQHSIARSIVEKALLPSEPWRSTYESATRDLAPVDYRLARPYTPVPSLARMLSSSRRQRARTA